MKMETQKSSLQILSFRHFYLSFPLLLLLRFFAHVSSVEPHEIPFLDTLGEAILIDHHPESDTVSSPTVSNDFKTYFYTQTLDHFNYGPHSYATFKQRYLINYKYWGGAKANSPIFVYFGAEAPLDRAPHGFLPENAPRFKALLVYIEHRYYGKSSPLGSMEEALKNDTIRGYLTSAQALADYAEILIYIKEKLSAHNSPIIVIGGSYGGMLASWFRLKYPHIALGALASSAPILYFDDITPQNGYFSIVTKDFKEVSQTCYQTIRESWSEIDKVASKPHGLSILSQKFKLCSQLKSSNQLTFYLERMYSGAAQYNHPPNYPVTLICNGIDGAPNGTDVIGRIFAGVVSYRGKQTCYYTNATNYTIDTRLGWRWQTCSEMVIPIGIGSNDTMFPSAPFDLSQFIEDCKSLYGVSPRPHWVTTYYGGHNIKLVLRRFASNIIFSNGLRDPYSSGGVLEDISKSVVAIYTINGSHCLDIRSAQPSDPEWLVMQRKKEIKVIKGWITKYYADLLSLKK